MQCSLFFKKWARSFAIILFLIGMIFMIYFQAWWPGILLVLGLPLALKQFLERRRRDALVTLIVFVGFFSLARFDIPWKIFLIILFVMAVIYILCKEWFEGYFFSKEKRKK